MECCCCYILAFLFSVLQHKLERCWSVVNLKNKEGENTNYLFSQQAELTVFQHLQLGPIVKLRVNLTLFGGHFKCIYLTIALVITSISSIRKRRLQKLLSILNIDRIWTQAIEKVAISREWFQKSCVVTLASKYINLFLYYLKKHNYCFILMV